MKKLLFPILLVSILVGCSKDDDDETLKGLVQFIDGPTYANEKITFQAEILYSAQGKAAELEFQILEGDVALNNEKVTAENNVDGIGFSFRTPEIIISTPLSNFAGKNITIYLDPENKLTSPEYTSAQYVDTYKKKTVNIPQQ